MRVGSFGVRWALGLPLALHATSAYAQDAVPYTNDPARVREGDPLRAQQLFDEALSLADEGRWAEACPKFRESLTAEAGVGTLLNVASCSSREGKTRDAVREYRRVLELNAKTADLVRRRVVEGQAQQALKELAARLATLTIVVSPERAGAWLEIDGVPGKAGVPVEVEIGDHLVVVQADGFERAEVKVRAVGGQNASVPIKLVPVPVAGPVSAPAERHSNTSATLTAAWVTGLAGVSALAAGGLLVGLAADRASEIRDVCGPSVEPPSCPLGAGAVADELSSQGQALAIGGYVSLGVGGAAVATSIALLLVDAVQPQEPTPAVSFTFGPGAAGLSISGWFQ